MEKAERISQYLNEYQDIMQTWLNFNVVLETPGSNALLTDADRTLFSYNSGAKQKEYICSVAMIEAYDNIGSSIVNMDAYKAAVKFVEWIQNKNRNKQFPDFGGNCMVENIEATDDAPQVTIDQSGTLARYMVNLRVDYIERS